MEVDRSGTHDENCQVDGYVCYIISFPSLETSTLIAAGDHSISIRGGLKNPISVATAGNFVMRTMIRTATTSGSIVYGDWAYIDMAAIASNYKATAGTIDEDRLAVEWSATGGQATGETYEGNRVLDYAFTTPHAVPRGGYVKVVFPNSFTLSSEATAVAQFAIRANGAGASVATIFAASAEDKYVMGSTNVPLNHSTKYTLRVAGLRNPRYLVDNSFLANTKEYWKLYTYDTDGQVDDKNLIDYGRGGTRDVTRVAAISTFSVEAFDTTNGVAGAYFITWYTEIETQDKDVLVLPFPAETDFVSPTNNLKLSCTAVIDSLTKVDCAFKRGVKETITDSNGTTIEVIYKELSMTLTTVAKSTGLYKVRVENVRNPPSLRGSSKLGRIVHRTQTPGQEIAQYTPEIKIPTEYGGALENLSGENIAQADEEYSATSVYEITFQPHSVVEARAVTLYLQYPSTIEPSDEMKKPTGQPLKC